MNILLITRNVDVNVDFIDSIMELVNRGTFVMLALLEPPLIDNINLYSLNGWHS